MAQREHQVLSSFIGMAPYADPADLPENIAQEITGFLPARLGTQRQVYALKQLTESLAFNVEAMALFSDPNGAYSTVVFGSGTNLYKMPLIGLYSQYTTGDVIRGKISLGNVTLVTSSGPDAGNGGWRSIQYDNELIIVSAGGGNGYRIYVDVFGFHIFDLGLVAPAQLTLPVLTGAAEGLKGGGYTYSYLAVWVDEMGRESSPDDPIDVTTPTSAASFYHASINKPGGTTGGTTGITFWRLYRKNPGATTYNRLDFAGTYTDGLIPVATTSVIDFYSDSIVALGAVAPTAGENDKPDPFSTMCVWKDRLVLDSTTARDFIQISNAGSPTQFSNLPLPTNVADGIKTRVASPFGDPVVGMHAFGSVMLVFKLRSVQAMWGDDITSFSLRPVHERGCVNADSIQRVNDRVFALLEDGPYSFGATATGYGVLNIVKDTLSTENFWRGFAPQDPSLYGPDPAKQVSVELAGKQIGTVTSFYHSSRYYISIADRTWVYDLLTGEGSWTDTGYGYITAAVYLNTADFPESVLLSLGGYHQYTPSLYYFCATDKPGDSDYPLHVSARCVTRPFDGGGETGNSAMRSRRKQALLYQISGSCPTQQKLASLSGKAQLIGYATFHTDSGYKEGPYPMMVYPPESSIYPPGILWQAEPLRSCEGRLLWMTEEYIVPDIQVSDRQLQYTSIS